MNKSILYPTFFISLLIVACSTSTHKSEKSGTDEPESNPVVYESDDLVIQQLSGHVYRHISFLNTVDFGRVECNGMVVVHNKEVLIFDSPASLKGSAELIDFLANRKNYTIVGVVPTHFHDDCVGGLEKFYEDQTPSFTSKRTLALLQAKGKDIRKNSYEFSDSLNLEVGGKEVHIRYFGEGHTSDNVIGYFPEDEVIFGGCLIKATGASKGNLEDANINAWSETVRLLKQHYPQAKIVIPGHGKPGGPELLDYTIQLFEVN